MHGISIDNPDLKILADAFLKEGKSIRFMAHGSSMSPFIRDGDYLMISPVKAEAVRLGDVVLAFLQDKVESNGAEEIFASKVVAHRIVRVENKAGHPKVFVLKGDALPGQGDRITPGGLLGRVESFERDGKKIMVNSFRNRMFTFYLVYLRKFFVGLKGLFRKTGPFYH